MAQTSISLFICSNCNKKITNGFKYSFNGKAVCLDCYLKLTNQQTQESEQQKLKVNEEDPQKKELYDYIKKLFKITDIPSDVISFIEREIKYNRMKYSGIKYAIYYTYELLEQSKDIMFLTYNLQRKYEEAKLFYQQRKDVNSKNDQFEFKETNTTVVVTREALDKKTKKKPKYSIEDL